MTRFFGYAIGALWLVFAFMAFSASSAGAAANQPDAVFWWRVIMGFYALCAVIAVVGTVRYRYEGPRKYAP